jgi:hypothetical protein
MLLRHHVKSREFAPSWIFLLIYNRMAVEELITMLEKYGIKGLLIGLAYIIIRTIIKSEWFGDWWSKFTDKFVEFVLRKKVKEPPHEVSESDILNHDVFNYIDFWTYSKVPTFQFSTEYRTIVFRKYLAIFLKNYKMGLRDFIQSKSYQKMEKAELWKSLLDLLNKIIMQYERECEEQGIPKIVVLKMKAKNNDTITLIIDIIENITNSQFYESDKNYLKIYSILNILLSILENTISNSIPVCNSINGQLKGLSITDNGKIYTEP